MTDMAVELTELEKLEVTRVDAVGRPANGFPVLMMKGLPAPVAKGARDCPKCEKKYDADHEGATCENCGTKLPAAPAAKAEGDKVDCPTCNGDGKMRGNAMDCPDCENGKVTPAKAKTLATKALVKAIIGRKVDETPDIAGGTAVLGQIADLIIAEAQELKSGVAGEISDIQQLACAAEMIWCWRTGEESVASGSVMPAASLMQSAAALKEAADAHPSAKLAVVAIDGRGATDAEVEEALKVLAVLAGLKKDRDYSAAERKEMAGDGRALPDGSYPINDERDLNSAAILARSGHGDAAAAKKHIAKRAKELGVANPLDSGGDTAKSEIAKDGATVDTVTQETGDLAKVVEDAVTKATAPLQERIASLDAELAKVKATPVPGGPMMSVVRPKTAAGGDDPAAKAIRYEQHASTLADPREAELYRQAAAQERAKITS